MKKIFTIALLAATVLTVNAATRKWDFRSWSSATVENLKAGAGQVSPSSNWSDIEKTTATAPTDASKENCYWEVSAQGNATSGATIQANSQNIAELEGLLYTNTASRSLAIAVNYPTTSLGNYNGGSYLWLGSSKKNYFVIPNVKAGATIKIGIESHKPAEARGVNLYIVAKGAYSTLGTQLKAPDGSDVAIPTTYEDQQWIVPSDGLTDTPNEDGTYDVMIYNTNGCHLYYITVEEGGSAEVDKNVAWVSADPTQDYNRILAPTTGVQYTNVLASATMTADELRAYDAVVVSTDVTADSPMGQLLADNIAYVPMVNLNTSLFGYTDAQPAGTTLTPVDKDNDIFTGVEIDENNNIAYTNVGVTLPERFASDNVLAKNGDAVAIHQHTPARNSYILVASDATFNACQTSAWTTLMTNAISKVASTKKSVTKVATPTFTVTNEEGSTTVAITCSTSGAVVKYAIDEGEWQVYSEPFKMEKEGTVYAYATAEGYLPMTEEEAASQAVTIMHRAPGPDSGVEKIVQGDSVYVVCSLWYNIDTPESEKGTIYYNYSGSSSITESVVYTEPFQIFENCNITYFAVADGMLQSVSTTIKVEVPKYTVMEKELGHFNANKATWSNGQSKTYYYCYLKDGSSKKYNLSENYTCEFSDSTQWTLRTSGQQVVWESTTPLKNIGDVSNYNPVRAIDNISNEITGGEITFGTTASVSDTIKASDGVTDSIVTVSDAPSAELVSIVKFQAPFNVVTYVGAKPGKVGFEYFVSTDNENWTSIGKSPAAPEYTDAASKWRLWHRDVIKYDGTDQVYLKLKSVSTDSYRVFDVFVKGEGTDETAIREVASEAAVSAPAVRKFVQGGQILIQTPNGTFTATGARVK